MKLRARLALAQTRFLSETAVPSDLPLDVAARATPHESCGSSAALPQPLGCERVEVLACLETYADPTHVLEMMSFFLSRSVLSVCVGAAVVALIFHGI